MDKILLLMNPARNPQKNVRVRKEIKNTVAEFGNGIHVTRISTEAPPPGRFPASVKWQNLISQKKGIKCVLYSGRQQAKI